jgi:hypothetical protein
MADTGVLEGIEDEMAQRNAEAAAHMERFATMLRTDQLNHGMAELAEARRACADELREFANLLNPQEDDTG